MKSFKHIASYWKTNVGEQHSCLCMTGSAARNEQTYYSDVDFVVLLWNERKLTAVRKAVRALQSEYGNLGFVLRTVNDCRAMLEEDIRSWLALLDIDHIAGDSSLITALSEAMHADVKKRYEDIFESLNGLIGMRHRQYGSSTALLEPNIKNSAGTLRDIHMICYLQRCAGLRDNEAALLEAQTVADGIDASSLLPERKEALKQAWLFFRSVRRTMHDARKHLHDTLEFELQPVVAAGQNEKQHAGKETVEEFMRNVYRHSANVHLALQLSLSDQERKGRTGGPGHTLFRSGYLFRNAREVLQAFLLSATDNRSPDSDMIRAVLRCSGFDYQSSECNALFDQLLRGERVAATLRSMHQCAVLTKVLPEFGSIEHFFQHNVYHYYTVDEHTIKALEAAEQLRDDDSIFGVEFAKIQDKSILYYAILLHDIAKPLDIGRHEELGAAMVQHVLHRYGRQDAVETVAFLVRHHLKMEQMALRRNVRDWETVSAFKAMVENEEHLRLLFLLTYADMSALNPAVFTEWKKEMLADLYKHTRRAFQDQNETLDTDKNRATLSASITLDKVDYRKAIEDVREGEPVRVFFNQHRGCTEIVVICMDRPNLLAQLSGALLGSDVSVLDASIETRMDVAIDMFRVTDIVSGENLDAVTLRKVEDNVRAICMLDADSDEMYSSFRKKWVRKIRKMLQRDVIVDVRFIDANTKNGKGYTIVEVYAPDVYGLLYILCREISAFGLDIVFAKIATRVDGVVDSFYVREASGLPFTDISRREALRQTLLGQVADVTNVG
jgi:[protein-PII] uridylyltransferase